MEDFSTYRKRILKVNSKRVSKNSNSFTLKNIYRWAKKNKYTTVTESTYSKIIHLVHYYYIQNLKTGHDVIFPEQMGQLEIRKYETKLKLEGEKVIAPYSIDWNETLKLWHEDKECEEQKLCVKPSYKETIKLLYRRGKAKYKNKQFYSFFPNRKLKVELKEMFRKNEIDAFKI